MPILSSDPDAIDTFIACVTHGLIFEVFSPAEASKLLYAAQVTIGSRKARTQTKPQQESKPETHPIPLPTHSGGEAAVAAPQVLLLDPTASAPQNRVSHCFCRKAETCAL
jgi:hypothetical protein